MWVPFIPTESDFNPHPVPAAGIPDFRSPGCGLYHNLQKYKLPHPQAIFELDFFRKNPRPFFELARELYPGTFKPTPSHHFIKLLQDKGYLLRHYTQNVDTLERLCGISDEKLVEAHGTFHQGHCLKCNEMYSQTWMRGNVRIVYYFNSCLRWVVEIERTFERDENFIPFPVKIFTDDILTCELCGGIVKPDIVFFGENLPDKFYKLMASDFSSCDLLIIMGSSLAVQPFASLVDRFD